LPVEGVLLARLALRRQQIVEITRNGLIGVVYELHSSLLEEKTHGPLTGGSRPDHHLSITTPLPHGVRGRLVKVNPEAVERAASVYHDCVVWSEPAQEGDEVAVAMPFDGELEVGQR